MSISTDPTGSWDALQARAVSDPAIAALVLRIQKQLARGSIQDQLDYIYMNGINSYIDKRQAIDAQVTIDESIGIKTNV